MTVKLSDYVMQFIAGLGVKHVFLLPGGGAMHLNDSLGRSTDLEFVANLHEQASAIAAEAYARVTNHLGVALVTSGPGGTNAITGVAGAWLESIRLFLSGQVKRSDLKGTLGVRQLGVQEVDIVSLVAPITKYAVTILVPATIRRCLEQAVYLARSGRPGPVWIDIPLDVQAAQVDPERLEPFHPPEKPPRDAGLEEQAGKALALLDRAERPLLLAGNGIRLADAAADLTRLVDALNIPVQTTWLGIDLVAQAHPLFAGRPGSIAPRGANFALQNCDCLLVIGSRLDMALTGYAHDRFARAAKKIMVDVDPAEMGKIRAPIELAICADAGDFIRELLRHASRTSRPDHSSWIRRCQQWKARYPVVLPEHRSQQGPISAYYLAEVLSDELPPGEMIVSGSSGSGIEVFLLAFHIKPGQRLFHTRGLGAMGFGLPASIGACLASGRQRTICVDGDGGLQLNIQELETIRRLALPIKLFVIDNAGFASIRASQQNYFGRLTAADATSGLTLPDLTEVAAAYGLPTMRISSTAELRGKVREALASPGPVVCVVNTIPDEPRIPRVASLQKPDGSMASKPLEDLWPFLDREEFRANMIVPPLED